MVVEAALGVELVREAVWVEPTAAAVAVAQLVMLAGQTGEAALPVAAVFAATLPGLAAFDVMVVILAAALI